MEHDSSCVLESVSDGQNATENGEHCFDVGIAQNTKKSPCEFYEGSGCEHNGGLATRGRQNQRHEQRISQSAVYSSHSNRQGVDYSPSFSILTDTILSPADIVDIIK